jgi:hypothetical protein
VIVACLEESCPGLMQECVDSEVCGEVMDCIQNCQPGAQACIEECAALGAGSDLVKSLGQCGANHGCFAADGGGGGGGGPGDSEFIQCVDEPCHNQLQACLQDPQCHDELPCLANCVDDGKTGCTIACMEQMGFNDELLALGQCAGEAGCGNSQ